MRKFVYLMIFIILTATSFAVTLAKNEEFKKSGYTLKFLEVESYGGKNYAHVLVNGPDTPDTYYRILNGGSTVHRASDYDFLIINVESARSFEQTATLDMTLDTITSKGFSKTIDQTNNIDLKYYKILYKNSHYSSALEKYDYADVEIKQYTGASLDFKIRDDRVDIYTDEQTGDSISFETTEVAEQSVSTNYFFKISEPKKERFYLYQKKKFDSYWVIVDKIDVDKEEVTVIVKSQNNQIYKTELISKKYQKNTISLPNQEIVDFTIERVGAYPVSEVSVKTFVDLKIDLETYNTKQGFTQLRKGESITNDDVKLTLENFNAAAFPPKSLLVLELEGGKLYFDLLQNKNATYEDPVLGRTINIFVDRVDTYSPNWTADLKLEVHDPNIIQKEFNLKKGWNMVFVPLKSPKLTGCSFDYSKSFIYNFGKYSNPSEALKPFTGLWFKSDEDCKLKLTGYSSKESNKVSLVQGWNFLGVLSERTIGSFNSTCKLTKPPYYYNPETKKFVEASNFNPGLTYAVKVDSACDYDIG
ncbi:hypothetical protein HYT84_01765 [Candidatus Micrarchaeota archaeon]|nr:hypothetical protein [Candidatus Micrarchaeota archaeon]